MIKNTYHHFLASLLFINSLCVSDQSQAAGMAMRFPTQTPSWNLFTLHQKHEWQDAFHVKNNGSTSPDMSYFKQLHQMIPGLSHEGSNSLDIIVLGSMMESLYNGHTQIEVLAPAIRCLQMPPEVFAKLSPEDQVRHLLHGLQIQRHERLVERTLESTTAIVDKLVRSPDPADITLVAELMKGIKIAGKFSSFYVVSVQGKQFGTDLSLKLREHPKTMGTPKPLSARVEPVDPPFNGTFGMNHVTNLESLLQAALNAVTPQRQIEIIEIIKTELYKDLDFSLNCIATLKQIASVALHPDVQIEAIKAIADIPTTHSIYENGRQSFSIITMTLREIGLNTDYSTVRRLALDYIKREIKLFRDLENIAAATADAIAVEGRLQHRSKLELVVPEKSDIGLQMYGNKIKIKKIQFWASAIPAALSLISLSVFHLLPFEMSELAKYIYIIGSSMLFLGTGFYTVITANYLSDRKRP